MPLQKTATAYGLMIRNRILNLLSTTAPTTHREISLGLGSHVSKELYLAQIKALLESGQIVKVSGRPTLFFKYDPNIEITARGNVRIKGAA